MVDKKEPNNCWEFWDCNEEVRIDCPAYKTNSGSECWMSAGSLGTVSCPKTKRQFDYCWQCTWFIKLNSNLDKLRNT